MNDTFFKALPASAGVLALAIASLSASGFREFTFPPGNLQEWTQVVIPDGDPDLDGIRLHATSNTFGNRMLWESPMDGVGGLTVTNAAGSADYRGAAHNSAILRSPSFVLNGDNPGADLGALRPNGISFRLLGGMGAATGPANVGEIPALSVNQAGGQFNGFLGAGLRRADDDAYLLWGRRTGNAQGVNWQTITWDGTALAAAIAGDAPGTLYTVDLIDAAHGDWGWVAIDSLMMIGETGAVVVSVTPLDVTGAESGPDQELSVRFSREGGDLAEPLDVRFLLTGTATEFTDFEEIPGYVGPGFEVTIPAGQPSVALPVAIIPNNEPEYDRSVVFTIQQSDDYLLGDPDEATLWIRDFPGEGLLSVAAPISTNTWLPFTNPLEDGVLGSLFMYAEVEVGTGGFVVMGLYPEAAANTAGGGLDFGRNTASAPFAIFDYLDNKGAGSAAARVGGNPQFPMAAGGRYTMIAEVEMTGEGGGFIRGWIRDRENGSLAFTEPNATTSFSAGFTDPRDRLHFRLGGGGGGTTWKNLRVLWVESSDPGELEQKFGELAPERPFIYVDVTDPEGGEFGDDNEISFRLVRSGPPVGELEIPLDFGGTASADDFVSLPAAVTFADGESSAAFTLQIVPDELIEGTETLNVRLDNTFDWLVASTISPSALIFDRPIQSWLAFHGLDSAFDDADDDGRANVLEYLLGSSPRDGADRGEFGLAPESANTLRFTRDPDAVDVAAKVEWSTDLETWRGDGESDGGRTVSFTETVIDTANGLEVVEVEANVTGGPAARLFLRLSVDLL